jgi:hypothetical protein
MLAPCSASSMLCATLDPADGRASGIDDASARHAFGNYAMVTNQSISRRDHSKG